MDKTVPKLVLCVAPLNADKILLPERSELSEFNGELRLLIAFEGHALRLGQQPSAGTGAGVPSSHVRKTIVHIMKAQFGLMGLRPPVWRQALNDGQHPPTGTGARVPSGQILRSIVHITVKQLLGRKGKIAPCATPSATIKQIRDCMLAGWSVPKNE